MSDDEDFDVYNLNTIPTDQTELTVENSFFNFLNKLPQNFLLNFFNINTLTYGDNKYNLNSLVSFFFFNFVIKFLQKKSQKKFFFF